MKSAATIVWDWNGTLLDDTAASLDALNAVLARRSLAALAADEYRRRFAFPVRAFYAEVGLDLRREHWPSLAREYHAEYLSRPSGLASGTREALAAARAAGARQVLVSSMHRELLAAAVRERGLADFFEAIYGTGNFDGGSKLAVARRAVRELGLDPCRTVAVGDALHDGEMARALGFGIVYYTGGGHAASRLAADGETCATLAQAVASACRRLRLAEGG